MIEDQKQKMPATTGSDLNVTPDGPTTAKLIFFGGPGDTGDAGDGDCASEREASLDMIKELPGEREAQRH